MVFCNFVPKLYNKGQSKAKGWQKTCDAVCSERISFLLEFSILLRFRHPLHSGVLFSIFLVSRLVFVLKQKKNILSVTNN